MLALVAAFLTFGLPRWLAGDVAAVPPRADVARLCREHGGTLRRPKVCTVRYGRRVYRMDAVTPDGFDEDAARYQRQGCADARREQRPAGRTFVYHPATGICEHRPIALAATG